MADDRRALVKAVGQRFHKTRLSSDMTLSSEEVSALLYEAGYYHTRAEHTSEEVAEVAGRFLNYSYDRFLRDFGEACANRSPAAFIMSLIDALKTLAGSTLSQR